MSKSAAKIIFEDLCAQSLPLERPDSRKSMRASTYIAATISYASQESTPCIVTNMSTIGFQVKFPHNNSIPDNVTLHIPSLGIKTPAHTIWQKENYAGLSVDLLNKDAVFAF